MSIYTITQRDTTNYTRTQRDAILVIQEHNGTSKYKRTQWDV